MKRPVTALAVLLLLALAALQIWRAVLHLDVLVAGLPVPVTASWIAAAVSVALAIGLLWERGRTGMATSSQPPPAAPVSASLPARSGPGDSQLEAVIVDGRPVPAAYFMFASKTLSVAAIKKAAQKYGRVLVGFDAGYIPMSGEVSGDSFKAARDLGAELEIYVEGPGGPTGDRWDPGEAARVKEAAESVGIDTSAKGWRANHWDKDGWKAFTFKQLAYYKSMGFNAAEIDNIERVIRSTDALIAFYKEYAARQGAGEIPQLVMKNVQVGDMRAVVEAIQSGRLPRAMFSEFHIFECGDSDEWEAVDRISKAEGIRTVPSRNTYQYDAQGAFGLDEQFNRAYGLGGATTATS